MAAGLFHTLPVLGVLTMEGATQHGERVLIVMAEQPDRVAGFDSEVQKELLERFHLECFRADHVLSYARAPWDLVERGGDPPDFVVWSGEEQHGVDCAVFADHHRRLGYVLMDHLRDRLVAGADGRDFSGVAGCVLSVWFGPTLSDLPPKRWDDSIIEPLLDAIAACRVDHEAVARLNAEIAQRGFPQVMPPVVATGSFGNNAGFVANVVAGPAEGARFSTGLGFEVQLSRPAELSAANVLQQVQRIVTSHDKPAIEKLILTAGGPDRRGIRYPAEEAVAAFLLAQEGVEVAAKHLRAVAVHLWSARRIAYLEVKAASEDNTT
jgi:hypothetical protein